MKVRAGRGQVPDVRFGRENRTRLRRLFSRQEPRPLPLITLPEKKMLVVSYVRELDPSQFFEDRAEASLLSSWFEGHFDCHNQ